MQSRYPWLWDTDLDNEGFDALLHGQTRDQAHDELWAMTRLVEYAPFSELKRLLPRERFLEQWPRIAPRVRSAARRKGMDFFHQWLCERQASNGYSGASRPPPMISGRDSRR